MRTLPVLAPRRGRGASALLGWIAVSLLAATEVLLAGCLPSPYGLSQGEECELNSDCDSPLVCRLGYCRRDCASSRDCAAGLDCLVDDAGLGACQLPTETHCVNNSECPAGLVCTMGECTNECNCADATQACRDCPLGSFCVDRGGGTRGCFDPSNRTCVYASDCQATSTSFVCAADRRCRLECRSDLDCRFGAICVDRAFVEPNGVATGRLCVYPEELVDAGISVDAGVEDASLEDASLEDASLEDASLDASLEDASLAAGGMP
ncbi:MAG: hypothetical protein K1X94_03085 [Sandaracinaceae bacterium]|nr:hypothetical protein [Sandaracinaceae bacterium]